MVTDKDVTWGYPDGDLSHILENPETYEVIEGISSKSPPCTNTANIGKFKLESICSLLTNISQNKEPFMKLMKYTKQDPVTMVDNLEYSTIDEKYGFTLKDNSTSRLVGYLITITYMFSYKYFHIKDEEQPIYCPM